MVRRGSVGFVRIRDSHLNHKIIGGAGHRGHPDEGV
jgi:hypothetical protein